MLTRIHLGRGLGEVGVQWEADDGAGGTVTQRAFVAVDDAVLAPVWLAAQVALDGARSALPVNMPAGSVTEALMKQRTAENAAKKAEASARAAKDALAKTEREAAKLDAELASKRAEVDALIATLDGAKVKDALPPVLDPKVKP